MENNPAPLRARKPRYGINDTGLNIAISALFTTAGLCFYGFSIYLSIQAGIGVAPWDTLHLGLSKALGITYGTANILVSFVVLAIVLLMREPIGIGSLLNGVLLGKFVDLFNWLNIVPVPGNRAVCLLLLFVGIALKGFGQYFYMRPALGCGPRDSMLVGFARHVKKVPIGAISIFIMATVTLAGWLLGGPIGLGTLLCAFLEGPFMQLDFKLVHFNATGVKHQDIIASAKVIFKKNK